MKGRCPKCHGNLYFETDIAEGLLLRKCLQCGLIESYFWLERSTQTLVELPPEDEPEGLDRELALSRRSVSRALTAQEDPVGDDLPVSAS